MDISNSKNISDFLYITVAAIVVDLFVVYRVKYSSPNSGFDVTALDDWYKRFGALAVAADVLSLMIGVAAARYICTGLHLPNSPLLFLLVVILFQAAHDLFFYVAVITKVPRGKNEMIDVFQDYAKQNGGKILIADALMMIGTAAGAMALKSFPDHVTVSTLLLSLYAMCYIVYTRRSPN
jgi:hypothetical protein